MCVRSSGTRIVTITYVTKMFIWGLVALCILAISGVEANFTVTTNPNDTAYRGGNITLPCQFDGVPTAVYWYKHNRTGAPDDQKKIVVMNFSGQRVQVDDHRYNITSDYSMVISDVQIEDETTYSCKVAIVLTDNRNVLTTGENYTDLMVIALAEPLHPVVSGCIVTEPGKCVYEVQGADTESFVLCCRVEQVRPAVSFSWTTLDGEERITNRLVTGPDEDGLFNATSELKVSRTEIGESFVCKAIGESVNGTSALVVTVIPSKGGLSSGGKAGIAIFVVLIIIAIIVLVIIYLRRSVAKAGSQ